MPRKYLFCFQFCLKISFRTLKLLQQLKLASCPKVSFHKNFELLLSCCCYYTTAILLGLKMLKFELLLTSFSTFWRNSFFTSDDLLRSCCCSVLLFQTQKTQLRRDEQLRHSISQQRFKTKIEYIHEAFQNV